MPCTPDERIAKLTDELENGVRELYASASYAQYITAMAKFHNYSFGNALLILLQCPHASQVAGYLSYFSDKNPYALFIVILLKICFIEKSEKTQVVFSDNFLHRH